MAELRFFTGMHHPWNAHRVSAAFISINTLRVRKSGFMANDWILDSGAFSTILQHGGYPLPVEEYAREIRQWCTNGNLLAAVAQDYMCEPHMLEKTGLSLAEHQRLTIERYDGLLSCATGVYIMPVLQGQNPPDYVQHLCDYGSRLELGAWVGVGTVCKRKSPRDIVPVLLAIKALRPDLRLHGFGVKLTGLTSGLVRELLYSADSMAWSFAARREGRNRNDWREAVAYGDRIMSMPYQRVLFS